jgi:tRNA pseudouridine55 synthase
MHEKLAIRSIHLNKPLEQPHNSCEGILLLNKPRNKTSFSMVAALRRLLNVQKIGHAGTLDPFATGVLVMLVGKAYTKLSDRFLNTDKEYVAQLTLGTETDTYDCEGQTVAQNAHEPALEQVQKQLSLFHGEILQTPPMFSAKKVKGKKLYQLARQGIVIERTPVQIYVEIDLLGYRYPLLEIKVKCSKGTYIRSLAHDLGTALGTGAHLSALTRTRSGPFHLADCIDGAQLDQISIEILRQALQPYTMTQ